MQVKFKFVTINRKSCRKFRVHETKAKTYIFYSMMHWNFMGKKLAPWCWRRVLSGDWVMLTLCITYCHILLTPGVTAHYPLYCRLQMSGAQHKPGQQPARPSGRVRSWIQGSRAERENTELSEEWGTQGLGWRTRATFPLPGQSPLTPVRRQTEIGRGETWVHVYSKHWVTSYDVMCAHLLILCDKLTRQYLTQTNWTFA